MLSTIFGNDNICRKILILYRLFFIEYVCKLIVVRNENIDTIGMSLILGVLQFAKYVSAK